MPDDTDEIVGSIGRELVSRLTPEELPLYSSLVKQSQDPRRGRGGKASSEDQLLGFGAAEAMTMLTPVILSFTGSFWKALVAEQRQNSAHGVVSTSRRISRDARRPRSGGAAHATRAPGGADGGRARSAPAGHIRESRQDFCRCDGWGLTRHPRSVGPTGSPVLAGSTLTAVPRVGRVACSRAAQDQFPVRPAYRRGGGVELHLLPAPIFATPRGPALVSRMLRCRSQALAHRPRGMPAVVALPALHQANVCYSGAERTAGSVGPARRRCAGRCGRCHLLGTAVVVPAAQAPERAARRWRRGAGEPPGGGAQRAGTGPVVWLLQPLNARRRRSRSAAPGAGSWRSAAGRWSRRSASPPPSTPSSCTNWPTSKNRDIDQTYLALAIWRAFVVAALLPLVSHGDRHRGPGGWQRSLWRVAALALIVYSLRNAVLRSREFDADARARELDPKTQLGPVLARPAGP